ncbi:FtsQ-type POTRA domain-containing protein [Alicyclobacillus tolerans]|uniref:cell division protein FtsQ/DivIB n=1 Tax=Alicyclobacillus tolerans TaxID=90970 RepID=UPI001F1F695C|nr:FtsQ-type POTRA domain-containing protein [Alicyclobacillus tolerans]MCF8564464.1 FtsQ-type POTRA domain-containing protein [Alicyclobacillus tolerans]
MHIQPNPASDRDRERRRSRNRKLVLGFFLMIGMVVVLESPLARVRSIDVQGNVSIPAANILSDLPIRKGASLWQVNSKQIVASILAKQPLIQGVNVQTSWFNGTLTLKVHEKHVVAVYEQQGTLYRLLNDGVVYDKIPAQQGFLWPIVTGTGTTPVKIGQAIPNVSIQNLCKQLQRVSSKLTADISEIQVGAFGEATMYLNSGYVAQCSVDQVSTVLPKLYQAVQYFSSKGYAPGIIDMTGQPPYRYTPLTKGSATSVSPASPAPGASSPSPATTGSPGAGTAAASSSPSNSNSTASAGNSGSSPTGPATSGNSTSTASSSPGNSTGGSSSSGSSSSGAPATGMVVKP